MDLPKRKSPRLSGYDYSTANHYFVTVCTHEKSCIFGSADTLNERGSIAEKELLRTASRFENVFVDKYVVMPNHIHAIIVIENAEKPPSLSTVIGSYKSAVSRKIHDSAPELRVWQKSFYDRIIRGDKDYAQVCEYIEENRRKLRCLLRGEI